MPRAARRRSKTKIYHVILRGINKQLIFEEHVDAVRFLEILSKYKKSCGYEIYGYCLMGNHVHLLIKEGDEELSSVMRRIGASFVFWYNEKYERSGHLFQDRYKSEVVEERSYLLNVLRYIHQNPVKANIVSDASRYRWSSYSEYIGVAKLVKKDFILGILHHDMETALTLFIEFHRHMGEDTHLEIHEKKRISDKDAAEEIKRICNVTHCTDLQKITHKKDRDSYLKSLKETGLSTRQIARLTGISRGVISKA